MGSDKLHIYSRPNVQGARLLLGFTGWMDSGEVSTGTVEGFIQKLGAKVGLVDADLYGPSIPTMLGLQGQRPKVVDVHGKPKITPLRAFDMQVMSIGFIIEPQQAVVLRGPRLAAIVKQCPRLRVLNAAATDGEIGDAAMVKAWVWIWVSLLFHHRIPL